MDDEPTILLVMPDQAETARAILAVRTTAVRAAVARHLKALAAELGQHEQTTHGSLTAGMGIRFVAEDLARMFEQPTAFTISQFAQAAESLKS